MSDTTQPTALVKQKRKRVSKRTLSDEQVQMLLDALVSHDRYLFGRRANWKNAAKWLSDKLGFEIKRVDLKLAFENNVEKRQANLFWRNEEYTKGTGRRRRVGFTSDEWQEMIEWFHRHWDRILPTFDTVASIARRMRHAGVKTNCEAVTELLRGQTKKGLHIKLERDDAY